MGAWEARVLPRESDFSTELDVVVGEQVECAVVVQAGQGLEGVVPSGGEGLVDALVLDGVGAGRVGDAEITADLVELVDAGRALTFEDWPAIVAVVESEEGVEVRTSRESFGVRERGDQAQPAADVVTEGVGECGAVVG